MEKRKTGGRIFGWIMLLLVLTTAFMGSLPAHKISAATLQPSNIVTQGTTIIKSYNCSIVAQRNSVGTTNPSQTYQIDMTGVGRIEAVTERYHGKCGNCNGSAGYTAASLTIPGVGSRNIGTDTDGTIALDDLEKYSLGITSVVLSATAGTVNVCQSCGGCGTWIMSIKSIKTYSYAPKVTIHPVPCSVETDATAAFVADGSRVTQYSWEQKAGGVFIPLSDTTCEDGMYYTGTNTKELKIGNTRYRGNQSVYRCVMTADNNEKLVTNEAILTVIDKTAPNVVITKNPNVWTNNVVCMAAEAIDIDTGLAEAPYSWDGGINYTGQSSHTYAENGSYSILVKDASENLYQENVLIAEIDRKAPILCVSANTVVQTKGPVTLLLIASDEDSGLCERPYYYDGTWHPEANFEVGQNGSYELRAKDKAGNETRVIYTVKNIKTEVTNSGNPSGEQNHNGGNEGTENNSNSVGGAAETFPVPALLSPTIVPMPFSSEKQIDKKKKVASVKKADTTKKKEVHMEPKKTGEPEEMQIQAETVEDESDTPAVSLPLIPEEKETGIWLTVLAGFLGLLIFALLLFFLFLGVLIEEPNMEGEGWRMYTARLIYRKRGCWHVNLGTALEECGALRLHFGHLLLALFEGWELILHTKGKEEGAFETEILQKLVLDDKRIRRK